MLKPSMQDLMKKVNNRYLLVNLSAQRARDLCSEEETTGKELPDKPVKLALDEISDGTIEYREGPKPEPEKQPEDFVAAASAVALRHTKPVIWSADCTRRAYRFVSL